MRLIHQIIVHQTGYPNDTPESIARWHTTGLGWPHIGYHFVITPDAEVHKTLAQGEVGYHCRGDNLHSVGICCVGAGDALPLGEGYMSQGMFVVLLNLIRDLKVAYPLIENALWGHREKASGISQRKPCPGWDVGILRQLL